MVSSFKNDSGLGPILRLYVTRNIVRLQYATDRSTEIMSEICAPANLGLTLADLAHQVLYQTLYCCKFLEAISSLNWDFLKAGVVHRIAVHTGSILKAIRQFMLHHVQSNYTTVRNNGLWISHMLPQHLSANRVCYGS